MALALASQTACTNNALNGALSSNRGGVNASDPLGGIGDPDEVTTGALTLSRVIRSVANPAQNLDLVGDGSHAMGSSCGAVSGGSGNAGPSTCTCEYSYIRPDGSAERFEAPTVYHDEDLIRCSYQAVPKTIPFLKVRVHLTNSDLYSNEVTFRFTGTGLSLDSADPASFVQVKRYQCKDAIFVPYLLDPGRMYDPLLSEDTELAYPLNFYTSNMGGALAAYVSLGFATPDGSGGGWICPPIPNDSSAGMDLTLFSEAGDGSGGPSARLIFPPSGSAFDRSTFYVARGRTGVFDLPINAYVAPNTLTSEGGGGTNPPPVGYGAAPVVIASGQETCPDLSVTIPVGYQWVKLWLFRAGLPDRKVKSSTEVLKMEAISCNPGPFPASGTPPTSQPVAKDCASPGAGLPHGVTADEVGSIMADRIVGSKGHCFSLYNNPACGIRTDFPDSGVGCTTDSVTGLQRGSYLDLARGTDVWSHVGGDANKNCNAAQKPNFMNLCSTYPGTPDTIPYDSETAVGSIDGDIPRYDFLFIVSPATVMSGDMKNPLSPIRQVYTPFRFYPGTCSSTNPDLCPASKRITPYEIKLHDISGNGDAPPGDAGRAAVFPMCVLQPTNGT